MIRAHSKRAPEDMPQTVKKRPATQTKPAVRRGPGERQRINLSLQASTVKEARALGLNLSRLAEDKISQAVREEKARRWQEENREAIEHHSRRIERDGPLNADLMSF
jgi:antitoxin CcdA